MHHYHQTDTFPSNKICHHPRVQFRKNLLWMRTLRKRKKLLRNKNKKKWKKKNQKRESRRETTAVNKELKRIKKAEKNKRDKKEMWARLRELNSNFAKMKEQKNSIIKRKDFIFPRFCLF